MHAKSCSFLQREVTWDVKFVANTGSCMRIMCSEQAQNADLGRTTARQRTVERGSYAKSEPWPSPAPLGLLNRPLLRVRILQKFKGAE